MTEEIRKRFDFPNTLIRSQAVSHLIAAVLKEKVSSEKISQSTNQTPALNLLWEKCCSDNVVVRTACCEALVTLTAQGHAEFTYILNGTLNLIPSARNIHGLIKTIVKLLEMEAQKVTKSEEERLGEFHAIKYADLNNLNAVLNGAKINSMWFCVSELHGSGSGETNMHIPKK
ncbi:UNVERIFIED_CONTAM: hypothetical protein K2H54_039551 [Gekko kuhli]